MVETLLSPTSCLGFFERDELSGSIAQRAAITTDDTAGVIAATVDGLGVTPTTSLTCRYVLARSELVQLPGEWHISTLSVLAHLPLSQATWHQRSRSWRSLRLSWEDWMNVVPQFAEEFVNLVT